MAGDAVVQVWIEEDPKIPNAERRYVACFCNPFCRVKLLTIKTKPPCLFCFLFVAPFLLQNKQFCFGEPSMLGVQVSILVDRFDHRFASCEL